MTMGTSQMLSCMEERIHEINPDMEVTCFGQEFNPSTFAIAKADMMIRGGNPDNMRFGDTLSDDKFTGYTFRYIISNPPFGIDWKREQKAVEAESAKGDEGRFAPGLPKISDGQQLFVLNGLKKLDAKGKMAIIQNAVGGKLPESFDTYQIVEENNLIMCLFDLDCSAVFSGLSPFCGMISPAYKVLKCSAKILPKFADYWFKFVFDGRKFKSYAKNLRYTLNYDEFSCIPMALPNLEEQLRIAMFLDRKCAEIDSVIADTQRTIEEYKKLRQSVITEAVTKGVRGERPMKDSGIEWIGEIPVEWEVTKFKKLGYCRNGLTYSPENQCGEERCIRCGIPTSPCRLQRAFR